jgi:methylphosphonate synthase
MSGQADEVFLKSLGARILGEANDLKRTPEALAAELGISFDVVESVIAGRAGLEAARDVLRAMAESYPISLADVWLDADDTDHGVRIMTASESKTSSRIFDRRDRSGDLTEYYEYRDTAMSRGAPFKPEWIAELRHVEDADPNNPDVAYNNGHFMHQTTFFIGPVNFYWESGGRRYCAELDTGDSNYVTPFVPHSFTSRDPNQRGLIIAITYSGLVGRALRDFISIGAEAAGRAAGDLRDDDVFRHRLARHMNAESLSIEGLAARLVDGGVDPERSSDLAAGNVVPEAAEIKIVADALAIRPADLTVAPMKETEEVVVRYIKDTPGRPFPDGNKPSYRLTELARSCHQPYLKGFEVTVLGGGEDWFEHSLHQYVYNYGEDAVDLIWDGGRQVALDPGDSAYVRPLVAHRFDRPDGAGEGHLAVIRVPGQLTDQVLDEYASFATAGRDRVAGETRRWF